MNSMPPPLGRWVIARTDNQFLFLSPSSAGISSSLSASSLSHVHPFSLPSQWVLGRHAELPAEQLLAHGSYISREHLVICEVKEENDRNVPSVTCSYPSPPPRLRVYQVGKNPSFWGLRCECMPTFEKNDLASPENTKNDFSFSLSCCSALEFVVDTSVEHPTREEPTIHDDAEKDEQHPARMVRIKVPTMSFSEIVRLGQVGRFTGCRDDATIYFPDGLQLPDLHIAFELMNPFPVLEHHSFLSSSSALQEKERGASDAAGRSAASSVLSVTQMLAVPNVNLSALEGEEE